MQPFELFVQSRRRSEEISLDADIVPDNASLLALAAQLQQSILPPIQQGFELLPARLAEVVKVILPRPHFFV